jgi:signal transduction histidine kinase
MLFSQLTRLPERRKQLAMLLRPLGLHAMATSALVFGIAVLLVIWVIVFTQGDNLISYYYAASIIGVWFIMLVCGLRYEQQITSELVRPLGFLLGSIMIFNGVVISLGSLGDFWSIIPVVSTISFSLTLSWLRLRLQFIDVVLRQFVIFLMVILTIPLGYLLMVEARSLPITVQLLTLFGYCIIASLVIRTVAMAFKRLWLPNSNILAEIHEKLPRRLAGCTDRVEAIAAAEDFLAQTFRAPVAINRSLTASVHTIEYPGSQPLTLNLGYIKGWLPWFSETVNCVRTAGLYVQGHLQVLAALEQLHTQALASQALEELAGKAELAAMRSRIRPHFLFNTLNSIHSFVRDDPAAAEKTIELLANLMRGAVLSRDADFCSLEKELELSRTYLEIEKMRYGERLHYVIRGDAAFKDMQVPSFSVQPLVENAVKYSVEGQLEVGKVEVNVACQEDALHITVTDNGVGLASGALGQNLGIAVNNIKDRLRGLYGDNADLQLSERAEGGVEAHLRLPADRI